LKLHIVELILWPEEPTFTPVTIAFVPNKVNVFTGWSETGKSSIVSIVDYCLGNGRCAIPLGPIRDRVAWYGLRLQTAMGTMRIARRKPTDRDADNDYEVLTHEQGGRAAAERPERNHHLDQFKALMNTLARLSDLRLAPDDRSSWYNPASFRDMAAFNFLPQHIVANPYTLFFKTDTTEHREKLRRVFPLVLGAKTNDTLLLEHRLADLEKLEKRLDLELRKKREAIEIFRAQGIGSYQRAQELNLLPQGDPPTSIGAIIEALRGVVRSPRRVLEEADAQTTIPAVRRIEDLRRREEELDAELADAKRSLVLIAELDESVAGLGRTLARQDDRVRGLEWFSNAVSGEHTCPMCGSEQESAARAVADLSQVVATLRSLSASSNSAQQNLQAEALAAERLIADKERQLKAVRRARGALVFGSTGGDAPPPGQRLEDVYLFIGAIQNALDTLLDVEGTEGIEQEHAELVGRIATLRDQIDGRRQQNIEERALDRISELIHEHAEFMGLGHHNLEPVLDIKELNLRFRRPDAPKSHKGDLLWEIGSGANWMGYHLAVFFAVHEFLTSRGEDNPVPNFLIIDQPSQVYFPSDTFKERIEDQTAARQDDLARTRKIFELFDRVSRRRTVDLQIVVLEHADDRTWSGLDKIHKLRDWRSSGERLIPREWL